MRGKSESNLSITDRHTNIISLCSVHGWQNNSFSANGGKIRDSMLSSNNTAPENNAYPYYDQNGMPVFTSLGILRRQVTIRKI